MSSRIDLANIGEMANAINDPDLYKDLYVQLHRRVRWMEKGVFNVMAVFVIIALGIGLFSSFFLPKITDRATDGGLNLPTSVFGLSESGIGQLERHPVLMGIPLGIYLAIVLFALIATGLVLLRFNERRLGVLRVAAVVLVIGTVGAWIYLLSISSEYSAGLRNYSPALIALSVAALLGMLITRVGRKVLDHDLDVALKLSK